MVEEGLTLTQTHKDNISKSLIKYYSTHDGPWKGIKRNKEFRDSVRNALRKYWKTCRRDLNGEFDIESSWHKIEVRCKRYRGLSYCTAKAAYWVLIRLFNGDPHYV